jgi:ectoine hydroxylase-related dioxygenase (phytanoyl-CoA dioxygenase family)
MARNVNVCDEEILRYQRDGAALLKGALDADDLRLLEAGVEEIYRAPGGRYSKISTTTGEGETLVEQYVSQRSPALRALLQKGVVGQIAAKLMRTSSAQLILDQVFYKAKGPIVPTPWHQDTAFLRVRGDDMIRVWLPCDYSPRELTVQVVRGSHRWNVVYNTSGQRPNPTSTVEQGQDFNYEGIGDSALPPAPDVERYRDSFDILRWDVEPGDALVFQGNMLHGADGHPYHDRPRRAFATMLGGPSLRYHAPKGKAFPVPGPLKGVTIPHGAPIGDYEGAFPVCWRQ